MKTCFSLLNNYIIPRLLGVISRVIIIRNDISFTVQEWGIYLYSCLSRFLFFITITIAISLLTVIELLFFSNIWLSSSFIKETKYGLVSTYRIIMNAWYLNFLPLIKDEGLKWGCLKKLRMNFKIEYEYWACYRWHLFVKLQLFNITLQVFRMY